MLYQEALQYAKEGKLITRDSWNNEFVFLRPAQFLDPGFIIKDVKSLPKSYKRTLMHVTFTEGEVIVFQAHFCKKLADNSILSGWLANFNDTWANDWRCLDY